MRHTRSRPVASFWSALLVEAVVVTILVAAVFSPLWLRVAVVSGGVAAAIAAKIALWRQRVDRLGFQSGEWRFEARIFNSPVDAAKTSALLADAVQEVGRRLLAAATGVTPVRQRADTEPNVDQPGADLGWQTVLLQTAPLSATSAPSSQVTEKAEQPQSAAVQTAAAGCCDYCGEPATKRAGDHVLCSGCAELCGLANPTIAIEDLLSTPTGV